MSAGHGAIYSSEPEEVLTGLLEKPEVKEYLARYMRWDFDHDVPYLAGYNLDGTVIYFDRHLPETIAIDGPEFPIHLTLSKHEQFEKAMIDLFGMEYDHNGQGAHPLATLYEHRFVRWLGAKPSEYEKALRPYIKGVDREKLERVPRDLDLTPYRDENDYRIMAWCRAHGVR